MKHLRWVAALGPMLISSAEASPAAPASMARIPGFSLTLGTDLEGIIAATEQCSYERSSRPCEPEEFAIEQGTAQKTQVDSFYLDRREVSVADYRQCVRAGRCSSLPYDRLPANFGSYELPVVLVNHSNASDYCTFRGARLPSEAEFEAAARGPEQRTYPWGFLDHHKRANAGDASLATSDDQDGFDLLAPASAFWRGQSPQGVLQLAGNVAEWTSTVLGPHGETATPGQFVVKGGSFSMPRVYLRATARVGRSPGTRASDIGFRCARTALVKTERSR